MFQRNRQEIAREEEQAAHWTTDLLIPHLHRHLSHPQLRHNPEHGRRNAGVLVPLGDHEGHPYLLFTRRSTTVRKHKGEISFPGGGYEERDGSVTETALREAEEELQIDRSKLTVLGELEQVFVWVSNYVITPTVALFRGDPADLRPAPFEVAELITIPLSALLDPACYSQEERVVNGASYPIHYYRYQDVTIWGATGRILYNLLQLLKAE